MIGETPGCMVYLACGITDMRKSIDGLAAVVPQNGYVRCSLAALCTQLQQPETALTVLAAAPDSPRAAQLRVEALLDLNRLGEASRELRRAGGAMRPAVAERLALRLSMASNPQLQ